VDSGASGFEGSRCAGSGGGVEAHAGEASISASTAGHEGDMRCSSARLLERLCPAQTELQRGQIFNRRRRSELAITETDERLIAALASMGLKRIPKNG
jgi:hypothetical protein